MFASKRIYKSGMRVLVCGKGRLKVKEKSKTQREKKKYALS